MDNSRQATLVLAEARGVRHVTYLSTYGSDQAPPEVDIRAVELDLMSRQAFTSSVLHPAWVMQNFTDDHLPVIQDMITVPTAGGAEAFVDAADIAAVAAETLADPDAHADAVYAIASGHGSRPNDDVRKVTGSPPASFADFGHSNAHAWAVPAAQS